MDCLDCLANFFGSVADWFEVIATFIAAIAAVIAVVFTKRAWQSQIRQESKTRKQLQIALDQERRHLEALERERRANGPYFETAMLGTFEQIQFLLEDKTFVRGDETNIFWSARITPMTREIVSEAVLNIVFLNRNSAVNLRNWKVKISPEMPANLVRFEAHTPPIRGKSESGNYLLRMPFKNTEELVYRVDAEICFETENGYIDTQEYQITIELEAFGIRHIDLIRTDPIGIESR